MVMITLRIFLYFSMKCSWPNIFLIAKEEAVNPWDANPWGGSWKIISKGFWILMNTKLKLFTNVLVWAAIIMYYRLIYKQQKLISHCSGGWMSKIRVQVWSEPSWRPSLACQLLAISSHGESRDSILGSLLWGH